MDREGTKGKERGKRVGRERDEATKKERKGKSERLRRSDGIKKKLIQRREVGG
jgi:hypothetical protein